MGDGATSNPFKGGVSGVAPFLFYARWSRAMSRQLVVAVEQSAEVVDLEQFAEAYARVLLAEAAAERQDLAA